MDRARVQLLVMGLVAVAIVAGPGEVRGMVVFSDAASVCRASLPGSGVAAFPEMLTGGFTHFAPSDASIFPVLSFAGTAAASPVAEPLLHEILAIAVPSGMDSHGNSTLSTGSHGVGAAIAAPLEVVPEDLLRVTLGIGYLLDWPAGPVSRLFRPPRVSL